MTPADLRFMDAALAQAFSALGSTAPNPAVGCVLVRDGRLVAAAATAPGGRPHAERICLEAAGAEAEGATAYVSLEPCAHHGATPPCADALIDAGVARVVIGCRDPFPRVAGEGAARLKAAGIAVVEDVRRDRAEALNAGFFTHVATGLPLVGQDPRAGLFDADLEPGPDESVEQALERMGRDGLTRVRLKAPTT